MHLRGEERSRITGSAAPLPRADIAHAIIDALERVGTAQDYYRLNHARPDQIGRLADMVAQWCREVGIPVEMPPRDCTTCRRAVIRDLR